MDDSDRYVFKDCVLCTFCNSLYYLGLIMNIPDNIKKYIDFDGPNGCWLWKGSLMGTGYGQFCRYNKGKQMNYYFHRYMWELANGPIPKGLFVCHHCDVRNCGNPEHLFIGTTQDNTADMMRKGRYRNPRSEHAKALPVEQIREDFVTNKLTINSLKSKYKTSGFTLRKIVGDLGDNRGGPDRKRKYTQEQLKQAKEMYATGMYTQVQIIKELNLNVSKSSFSRMMGKK